MMTTSDAGTKCAYCGSIAPHPGVCPTVKAIEYHPDGAVKRVEFKGASDYVSVPAIPMPQPGWPQPTWQNLPAVTTYPVTGVTTYPGATTIGVGQANSGG